LLWKRERRNLMEVKVGWRNFFWGMFNLKAVLIRKINWRWGMTVRSIINVHLVACWRTMKILARLNWVSIHSLRVIWTKLCMEREHIRYYSLVKINVLINREIMRHRSMIIANCKGLCCRVANWWKNRRNRLSNMSNRSLKMNRMSRMTQKRKKIYSYQVKLWRNLKKVSKITQRIQK
jgi:hypothetical protein